MLAEPSFNAFTKPFEDTVATISLSLVQVRDLFVAFSGKMVAVIVASSPTAIGRAVLSKEMPVTEIIYLVGLQEAKSAIIAETQINSFKDLFIGVDAYIFKYNK
jgi:hypothetical protein